MKMLNNKNQSCSLNSNDYQERMKMIREQILPHLIEMKELENGCQLRFQNDITLKDTIERFIELEKQCCNSLTLTLSEIEKETELSLMITGLKNIDEVREFFSLPNQKSHDCSSDKRGNLLKKTSLMSISTGLGLILLCELPWILALFGIASISTFGGFSKGIPWDAIGGMALLSGIGIWFYRKWLQRREKLSNSV